LAYLVLDLVCYDWLFKNPFGTVLGSGESSLLARSPAFATSPTALWLPLFHSPVLSLPQKLPPGSFPPLIPPFAYLYATIVTGNVHNVTQKIQSALRASFLGDSHTRDVLDSRP
jgi:hypothetical protein